MDGSIPILTDRSDIRRWKRLVALENAAAKGSRKNVDRLRGIIGDTLGSKDYENPKILCKIIDLIDLYLSDEMHMLLLELLEKCELTDFSPQMKAAEKLVAVGAYDSAKLVLDRMTVIADAARWEYCRGQVDVHMGDTESARVHFINAWMADDRYIQAYQELEQIDPDGGWDCRRGIAEMRADVKQHPVEEKGRIGELYKAYSEWYGGSAADAMDTLKRMVREGIESDVDLAMARIYASRKDTQEALALYTKAASEGGFSVVMEAAEAYLNAGDPEGALRMCSGAEGSGVSDRRLVRTQLRAAASLGDRSSAQKYVSIYLYNDYADLEGYIDCVRALIELQMHSEAASLISDMDGMVPGDPMIDLLSSMNDYASERYTNARTSAKKAVRKMPDDQECLLHISRVYMALGRSEKSLRYIDSILSKDGENRDALMMKKEVLLSKMPPDYEQAYLICQRIVEIYPDDAETMREAAVILSRLGNDAEALEAYRSALSVKNDPVLFLDIITTLTKATKYEDAVTIATEYDDIYGNLVDMWAIKGNSEYMIRRYEDAAESYTKAVELEPNNPAMWHSKGMAEEMAGEYELAEISYDKAVLMDLDNSSYWISKAAVQEKKGNYSGAIDSLNRVISADPGNVYSMMRKATILTRLGKVSEARSFVELASKIEPMNMDIMVARRDIYDYQGDTEATKAVCKSILSLSPKDKRTAIICARAYMRTQNFNEALTILTNMVDESGEFTDDDYEIQQTIREIYHTQGKYHEEISICKAILVHRPDDRDVKAALAEAYIRRNMIDAAKNIYDELHMLSPEDASFSLKKARMSEDKDVALAVLMDTLSADPDNKAVLEEVSGILAEEHRYADSLVYIDRAVAVDPSDQSAYVKKMDIQILMGDYRGVLDTVGTVSEISDRLDPVVWKYTGEAQMMLGDYANALISYDTAMKMGVGDPSILRYRGMCQEASGMSSLAIKSYESAYERDPKDTESMYRAAAVYLTIDRDQQAGRALDLAIKADPKFSEALIARATIYAARGNEYGVKTLFEHCGQNGVEGSTRQIIAELLDKVKMKED